MHLFTGDKLRDGSPVPAIGEWRENIVASHHPFDALWHASGCILHKVESEDDKSVGRRKIVASIDATELFHGFARWCASQVVDEWDAPAVVHEYLETGDESLREEVIEAVTVKVKKEAARWQGGIASLLDRWDVGWGAASASANASALVAATLAATLAMLDTAERAVEAARAMEPWIAAMATEIAKQRVKFKEMVDVAFGDPCCHQVAG